MNNCLILLTNYYPFHKGEEYLESEIAYLSEKFKDIYIISTMVSDKMEQTRQVPENVTVIPIGIKHSKITKVKMLANQFGNINRDETKKNMIKKDCKGKVINKLYCYYFESRAMDVYSKLEKLISKYDFNQYNSIKIYSYWLYITDRVGVELKNKYFKGKEDIELISRAHRYDLYEYAAPLKYLPQRDYLLNNTDRIYPCSQDGVDNLKETYPKYKHKVKVKRLGTISRNIICNKKDDRLYIVSCSAVRKVKRLDLLIESLVELEKNNIPYFWTHMGDGPEFDNIKKIAEKKLNKDNILFTGFLRNKDVLDWYKDNNATVFVNLSSSEGVPVSIMEAISMKLPVIATDVGGTREIVENDVNGYLLPMECTPKDVAERLMKINSMENMQYKNMCENAFQIWNERCNAEKLYKEFAVDISQSYKKM
jgi:colanic acid/amylovoran biosynthesis glycosyltransferase